VCCCQPVTDGLYSSGDRLGGREAFPISPPSPDTLPAMGCSPDLCLFHQALINKAIEAALAARKEWDLRPVADRAQIFLKAADMLSGPRRAEILAKTMVGQVRCRGPSFAVRWEAVLPHPFYQTSALGARCYWTPGGTGPGSQGRGTEILRHG
jgi:hypothetical protein